MNCMPITDVSVDGNFTQNDKWNVSFGASEVDVLANRKLTFESLTKSRVSFSLRSHNSSQDLIGKKTVITWSTSGTNKDSYNAPATTTVELIDNTAYQ